MGVTGRNGATIKHLMRSIVEIIKQGGRDNFLMADTIMAGSRFLVGRK